jgi:hypothetical protein
MSSAININKPKMGNGRTIAPQTGLPFYNSNKAVKKFEHVRGNCMWLFGAMK